VGMTEDEEKTWWLEMVTALRRHMTIEELAEAIGVSERTVCNWQNGERPMGLKAIRVYLLHVKLAQPVS
jgi:transcriptional regulator with XRE-family HTH domain